MIEIDITKDTITPMISRATKGFSDILRRGMERIGVMLEKQVKKNLSGPILHVQTGRLRSSITHQTTVSGDDVTTEVGSNVIYLAPHEFGAIIVPKAARALAIPQSDGSIRLVSRVVLPARRPLRASWEQIQNDAISDLSNTIKEGLENADAD